MTPIANRQHTKITQYYILSCLMVLCVTAFAKIFTLCLGHKFLQLKDPIFPFLNTFWIMTLSSIMEIAAIFSVVMADAKFRKLLIIATLSSVFMCYRVATELLVGELGKNRCPCLGAAGDWVGMSENTQRAFLYALLMYMLIGSYYFLLSGCNQKPTHHYADK